MTDKSLMELVEEFGLFKWYEGNCTAIDSHRHASEACKDADALLSEIGKRVAELERENAAMRRAMDPRRWTRELNDAWCLAIPDVQKAFEDLRAAAMLAARQEGGHA